MDTLVTALIAVLTVLGAGLVLASAIAMFRVRDALSRINVFTPATGMGLPMIVVAAFIYQSWEFGFTWSGLVKTGMTMVALVIVSSVASNTLARAAYLSGAPVDDRTDPNDLATDPTGRG